jgi:hypothetical protein
MAPRAPSDPVMELFIEAQLREARAGGIEMQGDVGEAR